MRTRPGFARLLPLMALTGSAAGTVALLASARPVQAPTGPYRGSRAGGVREAEMGYDIVDWYGRIWQLGESPGQRVRGLILPNAEWHGADLHTATLIDCDFRGA